MVTVAVIIGLVAFIATISAQQSSADEKKFKEKRRKHFISHVTQQHHHYHHKYEDDVRFFEEAMNNLRLQLMATLQKEKPTEEELAAALDTLFAGLCTNIETAYKTFKLQDAANRKAAHASWLAEKAEFEKKVGKLSPGAKTVFEAMNAVKQNKTLSNEEKGNEEKKLFFAAPPDQQNELAALPQYFHIQIKYEVEAAKRKAQFEQRVAALSPGAKKVYEQIKAVEEDKENEGKKIFAAATADEQKILKALYWHYVVDHHQYHIENEANEANAIQKAEFQIKVDALSPDAKKVFESIKTGVDNNTLSDEDKEKEAKKLFIAATADQQKELEALYSHRFENELKANSEQAATSAAATAATSAATTAPTVAAPVA